MFFWESPLAGSLLFLGHRVIMGMVYQIGIVYYYGGEVWGNFDFVGVISIGRIFIGVKLVLFFT